MPKVTITFDLPKEKSEHTSYLKYGHKFENAEEVLEWVREQIPIHLIECVE